MKSICYYLSFLLSFILLNTSCTPSYYKEIENKHVEHFHVDEAHKMAITTFIYKDAGLGKSCTESFMKNLDPDILPYVINHTVTDSILATQQFYSLPANKELPVYLLESIEKHLDARYLLVGRIINWEKASRLKDGLVRQLFEVYDLKKRKLIWASDAKVDLFSPDPDVDVVLMFDRESAYDKLIYKTLKKMNRHSNVKRIAFLRKDVE